MTRWTLPTYTWSTRSFQTSNSVTTTMPTGKSSRTVTPTCPPTSPRHPTTSPSEYRPTMQRTASKAIPLSTVSHVTSWKVELMDMAALPMFHLWQGMSELLTNYSPPYLRYRVDNNLPIVYHSMTVIGYCSHAWLGFRLELLYDLRCKCNISLQRIYPPNTYRR